MVCAWRVCVFNETDQDKPKSLYLLTVNSNGVNIRHTTHGYLPTYPDQ